MTMNNTTPVALAVPVEWQGSKISEVSVKRPKVKDLRALEANSRGQSQLDQGAAMIAQLTGLPIECIDELDAQDFTTISEVIAGFFPQGRGSQAGAA